MADNLEAFASFERKWLAAYPEQTAVAVFLPSGRRLLASAFGCLVHELELTAFGLREAQVASAKLAWWRQELIGAASGNPRHPISTVLFSDPHAQAVDVMWWSALADGAMAMLEGQSASNIDGLIGNYAALYTSVARVESALFDGKREQNASVATLWTIAHLFQSLPISAETGMNMPVPLDMLARHGLTRSMLAQPGTQRDAMLRDYLDSLGERIRAALGKAPNATLARRVHARLELGMIRSTLKQSDPMTGLRRASGASAWRNLWWSWREARAGARSAIE